MKENLNDHFWDQKFKEEKISWGFEPAESAIRAKDFFVENNIKDILIPGIGYGRNAKVFLDNGIKVTGIEISQNAIDLAKEENKLMVISIGYAACHWCHVMEEESFKDPEVAQLINDSFVAIMVDREERPDIDSILRQTL